MLPLKTRRASAGLIALTLGVLLGSCSATRHTVPPDTEELSLHLLIIEESPDGQVTHRWQRAEDFELSRYRHLSSTQEPTYGRIVLASGRQRDCDAENRECISECMRRPLARGFGHMTSGGRGKGGKREYCERRCMQPYLDCKELQEGRPQEFSAAVEAVDGLKRNHQTILVGSVVVIAGVVFVAVSVGAGLVVLAPAVLLAS